MSQLQHAIPQGKLTITASIKALALVLVATASADAAANVQHPAGSLVTSVLLGQSGGACRRLVEGYRVMVDPDARGMTSAELMEALRGEGIRDLYAIKTGAYAGQVVLGFFSRQSNADRRVAAVSALGFPARSVAHSATVKRADCSTGPAGGSPAGGSPAGGSPAGGSPAGGKPADTGKAAAGSGAAGEAERGPDAGRGAGAAKPATESSATRPVKPAEPAPASMPEGDTGSRTREAASRVAADSCAGSSFIVLADPADNGQDVLVLVYKLRAAGISDLFVVTADPNKGKVALGIYDTAEAAQMRVDELTALGFAVRSEARAAAGENCAR